MEQTPYPEIRALEEIHQKYQVVISVSDDSFLAGDKDYPAVFISLKNESTVNSIDFVI